MRRAEEHRVELADGRVIAVRQYAGSGTPIVLVHGLLDCSLGWERLAARLSAPCFVPDLPGFGGSSLPESARLSCYADDVVSAAGLLGVDRFMLVGHSLGGAVAGAITDRYPERIESLMLLAPAGFGRIRAAEALVRPGVRSVVGRAIPFVMANPVAMTGIYMAFVSNAAVPEAELLRRVARRSWVASPAAIWATRAVVASGLSADGLHARAMEYSGPARVIWGDRDRLVPLSHLDGVTTALPQAEVEIWPGMGHHPQRERPRQLARAVTALCGDIAAAEGDSAAVAVA